MSVKPSKRGGRPWGATGAQVDDRLAAAGVALTIGAEPTYVALNPEHAEWNTDALGPSKRTHARRMARELVKRLCPGAVVMETQGKQYPGEPLPRWVVGLYWRTDGQRYCGPGDLLMDAKGTATRQQAERLACAIGKAVGGGWGALAAHLTPDDVVPPEYEAWLGRWRVKQPGPAAAARGKHPVGWVVPMATVKSHWSGTRWAFARAGRVIVFPGEGPLGLRLPLDRVGEGVSRLALTVEVRDGELRVFLPPAETLAEYEELLRLVLGAARRVKAGPLVLEGYAPPRDPAVRALGLAADPGVLEVNVPASSSCAEFAEYLDMLDGAARVAGLRPDKLRYSGQHTGSGGGSHLLLGGPEAAVSPFFSRPWMLSSFVRFLQRHPSMSYLFTGLYTGPSSQAPRVDESEYEVPAEVELAMRWLERQPGPLDPWLMDRVVRHLLMDTVGNTHRAEICVDKLWNAAVASGRQGLVEFRAFEMPPEPGMLGLAAVLLRALAAVFAEQAYTEPLRDWGASLHDRFLLPSLLERDFETVLAFLRVRGLRFEPEWFRSWWNFRFPILGRVRAGGGELLVRQALEPWPLLGEQSASGGTARSVDASMDRVEIRLEGAWRRGVEVRANGVRVPLDAGAGGVRFRAFDAPWGLQPQVPGGGPVIFEVVERRGGRLLARCQYTAWRPDGGVYDGLPADEAEAASRVADRFRRLRVRSGERAVAAIELAPKDACTVDLRWLGVGADVPALPSHRRPQLS